jgi:hypothetical protein
MLRSQLALILMLMLVVTASTASAALIDRGNGMIYDSDLNITWLQDANFAMTSGYDTDGLMTQQQAAVWADNLKYGGFDDWRLPMTTPINGLNFNFSWSYNGSTDSGYNIKGSHSELMYMYYMNLGNISPYTSEGEACDCPWGLINKGPFLNLVSGAFWPGEAIDYPGTNFLLFYNLVGGSQAGQAADSLSYAWAVRDGDILSAPIPGAAWLLGTGLLGLIGLRRKFNN